MSKPLPKAIATAVTLTVAAATLMAFTRGDDSKSEVPSAATVPSVSGTTAPQVSGHAHKAKPKSKAKSKSSSATQQVTTTTATSKPSTTTSRSPGSTSHPTTPAPSPSPSPTDVGLLTALYNALHPHH